MEVNIENPGLAPCPFCGSDELNINDKISQRPYYRVHVKCEDCGTIGPEFECNTKGTKRAIKEWNNRATDNDKQAVLEEINNQLDLIKESWNMDSCRKALLSSLRIAASNISDASVVSKILDNLEEAP